jgi:hypothetical protein
MLSSQALDEQIVSGISLGFALIFFVPLLAVAAGFLFYGVFARKSVLRAAKILSGLWLVACVPAAFFIVMGYAFNSSVTSPLVVIPLWAVAGLVALWVPVGLRAVFGIRPV